MPAQLNLPKQHGKPCKLLAVHAPPGMHLRSAVPPSLSALRSPLSALALALAVALALALARSLPLSLSVSLSLSASGTGEVVEELPDGVTARRASECVSFR